MTQLDGLRAFAAVAVLLEHSVPLPSSTGVSLGGCGVRLFFVLSGFLITGILLRERNARAAGVPLRQLLRAFYARRFLRIFPLYYAVLLLAVVLWWDGIGLSLPWHLTYTGNLFFAYTRESGGLMALGHFWTLAVEEQFYIVWPFVVLLVPLRWMPSMLAVTVVTGPLSRAVLHAAGHSSYADFSTTSCLDSLGLGAGLAALMHFRPAWTTAALRSPWAGLAALLAATAIVAGFKLTGRGYALYLVLGPLGQSVAFAWLVGRAAIGFGGVAGAVLECQPVVYVGRISYGLYVYHGVVPHLLTAVGWPPPEYHTVQLFTYLFSTTLPVAALSWHLFEKPLNDLKRYFPYPARPVGLAADLGRPAIAE